MQQLAVGVWKLSVTVATGGGGGQRRVHRTVRVRNATQAAEELVSFTSEVRSKPWAAREELRGLDMDAAIERFLLEHLRDEKGREEKTVRDYQRLHDKWFAPELGGRRVRDVDRAEMDRAFGKMRRAGLSRSRLNQAKSLYAPFFRWAMHRGLTWANPMGDFELPTSTYASTERVPPEVDELCYLLREAVAIVPDVAPVLFLGAVTGMRRGELAGLRRSRIRWKDLRLTVDSAIDDGRRVKTTKTRKERSFHVDEETIAMLARICEQQDQMAADAGIAVVLDPFVFSHAVDGSKPMPPDYLTKRVAILKERLGIEQKSANTIGREDEALHLFRQPAVSRPPGKTGPQPAGGRTYREIGAHFSRSERWASLAVASAMRREAARVRGGQLKFDGSILALRKFTSSELLDAGFNLSMVAERQGHGPQVLAKHYAKSRRSSDRKAAEHLGRVVHGGSAS